MAAENFARSMPHILAYEGKFSDHQNDPGGKTYEGITQRVWDGYARNRGLTPKTLSKATGSWPDWPKYRNDIYRKQYWDAVRGDHLPGGVDFVVFDGAVNSGPSQSVKWLQRALGNVKVDGVIGEATVAAARAHKDHDALIADICFQRMNFLRALKTWKSFGTGWIRRVDAVRKTGQAWARGSVGPMPVAFTAPAA